MVDEVLAVGDFEFQNKCIGKMREVATGGRTVLFVSHNLKAVQSFCTRCLWMQGGQVHLDGETKRICESYVNENKKSPALAGASGPLSTKVKIISVEVLNSEKVACAFFKREETMHISVIFSALEELKAFQAFMGVNSGDVRIFTNTCIEGRTAFPAGNIKRTFSIPGRFLRPGKYQIGAGGNEKNGHNWLWVGDVIEIEVFGEWETFDDMNKGGLIEPPSVERA